MRRALLGLGLALLSAPLSAQVERVGPARVQADPGAPLAVAFRVRNPLASPAAAAASLPRGWPSLSPDADAPLAPGASAVRLLATVVPRGAAAASYVLRYRLGRASDSVVVAVRARQGIDVAVDQVPRFAVAGGEYAAVFRVTNRGNGPASLRLAVESTLGFAARTDAPALELAAGGSGLVRVTVATKPAAGAAAHRLTLRVSGAGATGSAAARVPLVARGSRGGVAVRTLPTTLTLRAGGGGDRRGGVPGMVSASGALTR
ncbi:MAG TPA: hypothetical protein VGO40_05245, partial [Longimicrobium sp.]|nr:hypothetical protein [Longimicrobium sp.]